jgi:hypothetical protein
VQQLATGTDGVAAFSIPVSASGTYRICETLKQGWSNSYPGSLCYFQTLSPGNYSYDFINASDVLPATATVTETPTPTPGATATTPPVETETATQIPPTPTQAAATVDLTVRVSTTSWQALAGWNVRVTNVNNGAVLTDTTNASGTTQFALQAGRYQICETLQANWQNVHPGGLCYYQTLSAGLVSLDFLNAALATATPTQTVTPVPSTATSTPTSSPVPATATATPTPTNTSVPATSTNTPVPPTATRTPTVTPSTTITVVDNLNNLNQIVAFSNASLFTLESGNANLLGGDPSRLVRTVTTSQWATWRLDGMRTFIAQTYFWPSETIANFTFSWSGNGVSFTSITPVIVNTPGTGANWRRVQYTLNLPASANYVRVIFPTSGRTWNPEVGSVTLIKP